MTKEECVKVMKNNKRPWWKRNSTFVKNVIKTIRLIGIKRFYIYRAFKALWCHDFDKVDRWYHTSNHVVSMLKLANEYKPVLSENYDAIIIACLYHDIVYDRGEDYFLNEENSVNKMADMVHRDKDKLGSIAYRTLEVAGQAIRATGSHTWTKYYIDKTEAWKNAVELFLDFDMSILAAGASDLFSYEIGISQEFYHMSFQKYMHNRLEFLERIYDTQIFKTQHFKHLEEKAKRNIRLLAYANRNFTGGSSTTFTEPIVENG